MYFYYYFGPLNNDYLNLHTNSYNISVTQQQFSLVSLGVCGLTSQRVSYDKPLWRITTGFILRTAILLQTQ